VQPQASTVCESAYRSRDDQGRGSPVESPIGLTDVGQTGKSLSFIALARNPGDYRTPFPAVDRGEEILREMGFREFRVRHHDSLVRLEIGPAEMERALRMDVIEDLARRFRELGFKYVTLDLTVSRAEP